MGRDSKIAWTHHTFNPWIGCIRVSEGCVNCYAERQAHRMWPDQRLWGAGSIRRVTAPGYWQQPLIWEKEAIAQGVRFRVFCGSMCDIFEDHDDVRDNDAGPGARSRLWTVIENTPHLDWLLLTKRPENIARMVPWVDKPWPGNVWMGVTMEDQKSLYGRLPLLAQIPAAVRFISVEPLVGPLDLGLLGTTPRTWGVGRRAVYEFVDWVIVGGESGPHRRRMKPEWARALRDECSAADVAFFFKQWDNTAGDTHLLDGVVHHAFPKGAV